jgi:hypothetical protein
MTNETKAPELDAKDKRIKELEDQLKMVLDREGATHSRHDAKTDKLEAHIAELEAKLARVIEVLKLIPKGTD